MNDKEKDILKSLTEHPWFKLLEKLEEEALNQLWRDMFSLDISKPEEVQRMRELQIKAVARQEFFQDIISHTHKVIESNAISLDTF